MKFFNTEIPEVYTFQYDKYKDNRGYFSETFRKTEFNTSLGKKIDFCQENESFSLYGTIRGLHYQKEPFVQSKLVRVVCGEILDIAVDIRPNSKYYKKFVAVKLSSENGKQLFIPKGFAHGFSVLSKTAHVIYKVDNYYNKNSESGFLYNDKTINIDWKIPKEDIIVSEKDLLLKNL
jgi:dTDP-4-dehydrorhamnose 3,5-epimerase